MLKRCFPHSAAATTPVIAVTVFSQAVIGLQPVLEAPRFHPSFLPSLPLPRDAGESPEIYHPTKDQALLQPTQQTAPFVSQHATLEPQRALPTLLSCSDLTF